MCSILCGKRDRFHTEDCRFYHNPDLLYSKEFWVQLNLFTERDLRNNLRTENAHANRSSLSEIDELLLLCR